MRVLTKRYDVPSKTILIKNDVHFCPITRDQICQVFQLDGSMDLKFTVEEIRDEYKRMFNGYKRWKLPLHRSRNKNNNLVPFAPRDEPKFFCKIVQYVFSMHLFWRMPGLGY